MSKNIAENTREKKLINTINRLQAGASQSRTVQSQGSQSLRLEVIDGYFMLNIPYSKSGSLYEPQFAWVDLEAPPGTVLIGSLLSDVYVMPDWPQAWNFAIKLDSDYTKNAEWKTWLTYDTYLPDGSDHTMGSPAIPLAPNKMRVALRIRWHLDAGGSPGDGYIFVCYYQIRATIGQ